MPRKRTIADEELLDAVLAVASSAGPQAVTFQSVSSETGLSAATLVQRFGSKQKMLRAALIRAWDGLDAATAGADERAPLTSAGAVGLLVALSGDFGEDDDYAKGLLLLHQDMRDPVLRRRGARWGDALVSMLGRRLKTKRAQGANLGRLMAAQWQGIILWWGFSRKGKLKRLVAAELSAWCDAIGVDTKQRR